MGEMKTLLFYISVETLFAFTLAQHWEIDSGVVAGFTVIGASWCIYNSLCMYCGFRKIYY